MLFGLRDLVDYGLLDSDTKGCLLQGCGNITELASLRHTDVLYMGLSIAVTSPFFLTMFFKFRLSLMSWSRAALVH